MFRRSYTIIRERINSCLLKLQSLKQFIKIHRCVANTVVVWLHMHKRPTKNTLSHDTGRCQGCKIHINTVLILGYLLPLVMPHEAENAVYYFLQPTYNLFCKVMLYSAFVLIEFPTQHCHIMDIVTLSVNCSWFPRTFHVFFLGSVFFLEIVFHSFLFGFKRMLF